MTAYSPIKLLIPAACMLNANHREHWAPKGEKVKTVRALARYAAQLSKAEPVPGKVRVLVTFYYPPKTRRPHDEGNLHPTAKALVDGLTDAGLWPDDSAEWVEGPDVRIALNRNPLAGKVLAVVTLEPALDPRDLYDYTIVADAVGVEGDG